MDQCIDIAWTACEDHGLCAEILPELVRIDAFGYPLVEGTPVPARR
jgi:ferredoxin